MFSVKWFTPTGVGTIRQPSYRSAAPPVHPHGRGDNPSSASVLSLKPGSPPRAWGQSGRGGAVGLGERFTPTGVGTMRRCTTVRLRLSVHPHGRGDNRRQHKLERNIVGSPPRAWGQYRHSDGHRKPYRFTPTGVGTIDRACTAHLYSPVHPHGRGDNYGFRRK